MAEGGDRRDEPHFGGLMGGSRGIGLPAVRTLADEYRDTPEPEDSDRVPPPAPPGLLRRILAQLRFPRDHGGAAER